MPSQIATQHQQQRAAVVEATARAVLSRWRQVDPQAVARNWNYLLAEVMTIVRAGQLTAARQSEAYMRDLLGEAPPIAAAAFAEAAPDGRPLESLLALAVPTTLGAISAGLTVPAAMARGAAFLDMAARTVVADTGRQADQVAMVATRGVTSYIRVLELPSCARCIVLAGKEYGVSKGFLRHPRCDCGMEPVTRTHTPDHLTPEQAYERMSPEQRRKAFGEAGVKAIADGADIGQVVRARKGMRTITAYGQRVRATTEGTTVRGLAGKRLRNFEKRQGVRYRVSRTPRLMPEEIYKQADDREHAIRLLRNHGYIY